MQTKRVVLDNEAPSPFRPQPLFPPLSELRRQSRLGAYVAFVAICLIWGTTFVAIRVAIETIPTMLVTALRFLSAGLVLLVVAGLTGARFPRTLREYRGHVICGLLMVAGGNTLVVYAEHTLSSGMAALLAATIPLWLAIMEWMSGTGTLSRRKAIGLALGFGGVGLLVWPALGQLQLSIPFLVGVAAMQASAIAWNGGTLYSRRIRSTGDPMANAVIQMLAGGAAVMAIALFTGARPNASMFSMRSLTALLYLSIFGSVIAYTAYLYAQTKLSAGKISSYAYVNPVVAVLTGALMLREPVTLRMLCAMAVILGGVAVIQLDRRIVLKEAK